MENTKCKRVLGVNIFLFFIGFPIWAGIYFGIYYPFLTREWTDDQCQLGSVFYMNDYLQDHQYSMYEVWILGLGLKGYACFSNRYSDSVGSYASYKYFYWYPYDYPICDYIEYKYCLPRWICNAHSERNDFIEGRAFNCKWWLNTPLDESDPSKVELSIPSESSSFIELMLKEEVYIPPGDYWCLMVFPLGLMSCLTCFLNFFVVLPRILRIYTKVNFIRLKDFCCLKVIKKRNYVPGISRIRPKLQEGRMAGSIAFLYVYDQLKDSLLKLKPGLLRNIVNKLNTD